jgi:hypothetical protein
VAPREDARSRANEGDSLLAEQIAYYRALAPEYETTPFL